LINSSALDFKYKGLYRFSPFLRAIPLSNSIFFSAWVSLSAIPWKVFLANSSFYSVYFLTSGKFSSSELDSSELVSSI